MARYRIVGEIGRGAMGYVVRAVDEETGREVALKLLGPMALGDAAARARFESEARALAALDHPGIVKLLDTGTLDDRPYVAMQLLTGEDLHTAQHRRHPLPPSEVLSWIIQAADALAYIHERGMLHRDIKPSNLMVDAAGRVTLTDFGLARQPDAAALTAPGSVVGTLRYLSPEVLAGTGKATPAADVYALALTLTELLAGEPWCGLIDDTALGYRIVNGPGPDLGALLPEAPSWLCAAIASAIHRDPAVRPGAAQLRDTLTAGSSMAVPIAGARPPPEMEPPSTARLAIAKSTWRERYRVIEKLGAGAMGVVYRAEQHGLSREVALKCISPDVDPGLAFIERFRREAKAMSRVTNPGLVKVFDVSGEGEDPYMAMELIHGRTLEAAVLTEPLAMRRASSKIFGAMLEAVAALHDAGLTHRDLKPGNIMITHEGQPIVMDLGLVKDLKGNWTELTKTGTMVGTPAYLAPEILVGNDTGTRLDVWALGAIWFFVNAGRPLFSGDALDKLFRAISYEPLPDLAETCPDLAPPLRAFMSKLLERDPAKRPRDARRALIEFRRAEQGHVSGSFRRANSAPPVSAGPRPLALAAGMAAVALAAGAFAFSSWRGAPARPPPSPSASAAPVARRTPAPPAATRCEPVLRPTFGRWRALEPLRARMVPGTWKPADAVEARRLTGLDLGNRAAHWAGFFDLARWLENPVTAPPGASSRRPSPEDELIHHQMLHVRLWDHAFLTSGIAMSAAGAIQTEPQDYTGWLIAGYLLEAEGQPKAGLTAYRRGLHLLGDRRMPRGCAVLAFTALARAFMLVPGRSLEQEWPKRLPDQERASWRVWRGLQQAFEDSADRTRVRSMLRQAMKSESHPAEAGYALAQEIDEHDRDPEAMRALCREMNKGNDQATLFIGMFEDWLRRGRIEEARKIGGPRMIQMYAAAPARAVGAPVSVPDEKVNEEALLMRALEMRDPAEARKHSTRVSWGRFHEAGYHGDMVRAGDRGESEAFCRALLAHGEPSFSDLDRLAGALAAPLDLPWVAAALAKAGRAAPRACDKLALALWHSRSERHKAALDRLDEVRADPHVAELHDDATLEVYARPLWLRGAGRKIATADLARLPGPAKPPGEPHVKVAAYWQALLSGDAKMAFEAARACVDMAPGRPVYILALAWAAAALADKEKRAQGLTEARAGARFCRVGLWVLDEIERAEAAPGAIVGAR